MKIVTLGVHILDVLVRAVDEIPPGQGSVLVEQIRLSPAGTAGGTALTLAKLGAEVLSAGAVGDDHSGRMLISMLEDYGISTQHLLTKPDTQTSASVLPIRRNGDRPAFHVVGATAAYTIDDVPLDAIAGATHLHFGAPEFLGGEVASKILAHARENGVTTSADILAEGNPGLLEWIAPALPYIDFLLPNDQQVTGFTGTDSLEDGCLALLERGVGCIAATSGPNGALVVDGTSAVPVPAYETDVVDTTGCGDAFSAGFLRGHSLGLDPVESARFGCAAAAHVAAGLGSDHGNFDLTAIEAFVAAHPPVAE
ncbi:sugar/nucleoside kinase (ribokinase family) [Rhodococcus sp. 27YEA15]|uniref:carbohydrate kinase family protein n=1 Tax=Rhodococcus sp. 27YEA15 TaxID=3156259 RepID=UPI003C7D274D